MEEDGRRRKKTEEDGRRWKEKKVKNKKNTKLLKAAGDGLGKQIFQKVERITFYKLLGMVWGP